MKWIPNDQIIHDTGQTGYLPKEVLSQVYSVIQANFRKRLRPSWPVVSRDKVKPPWKDEFSDGCTFVADVPETMHCCLAHDKAYYEAVGGADGRRKADREFLDCMKKHGWTWRARIRWLGVRLLGGMAWNNLA